MIKSTIAIALTSLALISTAKADPQSISNFKNNEGRVVSLVGLRNFQSDNIVQVFSGNSYSLKTNSIEFNWIPTLSDTKNGYITGVINEVDNNPVNHIGCASKFSIYRGKEDDLLVITNADSELCNIKNGNYFIEK